MSEYPHLTNAPITEAVIDFRVVRPALTNIEQLQKAASALEPDYFIKNKIYWTEFQIGAQAQPEPTFANSLAAKEVGLRIHSRDDKYVAQLTLDGFTLSRLEPYESWEKITEEARRLWPLYRDAVDAVHISRIAVRYINNLRLPMVHGDTFDDYLTAAPRIAEGLSQTAGSFLQRYVIRDLSIGATATITHAYEVQNSVDSTVPVILDIDVFCEEQVDAKGSSIWQYLNELRVLKNQIFFKNLTAKGLSTYL